MIRSFLKSDKWFVGTTTKVRLESQTGGVRKAHPHSDGILGGILWWHVERNEQMYHKSQCTQHHHHHHHTPTSTPTKGHTTVLPNLLLRKPCTVSYKQCHQTIMIWLKINIMMRLRHGNLFRITFSALLELCEGNPPVDSLIKASNLELSRSLFNTGQHKLPLNIISSGRCNITVQ